MFSRDAWIAEHQPRGTAPSDQQRLAIKGVFEFLKVLRSTDRYEMDFRLIGHARNDRDLLGNNSETTIFTTNAAVKASGRL